MSSSFSEPAPAKVNLTLRILGKRADGYHDLESLVVFAGLGDHVTLDARTRRSASTWTGRPRRRPATSPTIWCCAPRASWPARTDGLRLGRFALTKHIPVAAGLGGGSADAAAALRLSCASTGSRATMPASMDAARATGADVPVCLDPRPRVMRGIGDVLSAPLELPQLPARAGQSRRAGADQGRVRQARACAGRDGAAIAAESRPAD